MILPADYPEEFQTAQSNAAVMTKGFFSENTPLKAAAEHGGRPYERRVQQEHMAHAVAEALEHGRNLCVEAPTGVGKSFAYLIPAIYHAVSMHRGVLITTETINLQEQLVNKDLPLLRELTGVEFNYVIAKGRTNYLCKRRLSMLRGEHQEELLPFEGLTPEVEQLYDWSKRTQDGSRSDIPFKVSSSLWPCVCCESASCTAPKCPCYHDCFYWKSRRQWDKADIIVTNHALFFTDLKIRAIEEGEQCPLPDYCAVIFDEAHTLEDNAANHLGIHVHSGALRYYLNSLFNPKSGRGLLMRKGDAALGLRGQISRVHSAAEKFFSQFDSDLDRSSDNIVRIGKTGLYEDCITNDLQDLERVLKDYASEQDDETESGFKTELTARVEHGASFRDEINAFLQMGMDDHVYWVERHHSAMTQGSQTELSSAPLNVAELLGNILFSTGKPVILTSATLAVHESLEYFASRIGFQNGDGLILDSPFDYKKQVKLYLSGKMPLPSDKEFNDAAVDKIRTFVRQTNGKAFVLFTSYGMLKYCAGRLNGEFRSAGLNLLVHGESLSRSAMLTEFKKTKNSVIFGATSFWTGVDVPGNALSNVIITKLPFAVPSHPLIEARCDRIRSAGGEPFRDYSIPEAVLKFRQGIGRLIRSKTDTGIIVVLDPRIVSKYYGRIFLQSIPECPVSYY